MASKRFRPALNAITEDGDERYMRACSTSVKAIDAGAAGDAGNEEDPTQAEDASSRRE